MVLPVAGVEGSVPPLDLPVNPCRLPGSTGEGVGGRRISAPLQQDFQVLLPSVQPDRPMHLLSRKVL